MATTREDTKLKDKIIKEYESELSELGDALRSYEKSQDQLIKERDYWKSLTSPESDFNSSSDTSELREKFREIDKDRIRAQEDAEHYKLKYENLLEELQHLREKSLVADNLKCQQAALKGEFGDIEYQLMKKNEQVKSSNQRYIVLQRKLETVRDERKDLEEKNKVLQSERKNLTEKWQNLVSRVKNEEKLRAKNKELEDDVFLLKQELENNMDRLKDAFVRIEEQQEQLLFEQKSISGLKDQLSRIKVQNKVLTDEREILAKMNQDLSIKVNDLEFDCSRFIESQRKGQRSTSEISFSVEETVKLQQKNQQLENEVKKYQNELKRFQTILKQKDELLLKLEIKVSEYENDKRKTDRYSTESLSGLIKNLVRESEQPLISAKDCNQNTSDIKLKYERLVDKYQRLEEQNNLLEKQLVSAQNKLKAARTDLTEKSSHMTNLSESNVLKDREILKLTEESKVLEDKVYKLDTNSPSTSPKIIRSHSITPEDAATTRYDYSPFSSSRQRVIKTRTAWKY